MSNLFKETKNKDHINSGRVNGIKNGTYITGRKPGDLYFMVVPSPNTDKTGLDIEVSDLIVDVYHP